MFNIFFFVLIPVILIALFVLGHLFPSITHSYGGIGDIINFLSSLFTYIYVVLTGVMVRQAVKSQQEESRPYVVADFEFEGHLVYLIIKNIGKRPALDVTLRFTPDVVAVNDRNLSEDLFATPFSFLPPGKIIKTFINTSPQILQSNVLQYDVIISYSDGRKKLSSETYRLDISPFYNILFTNSKGIDDLAESLEKIERNFSRVIKWDGIYIKTRSDIEHERQEREKFYKQSEENTK